jgi:nitrogen-specific signal transduction histidine kinase/CheY-like chemotaxis protein
MSLVENVTERVRMEKELLKVKKLESIGILAGGIAHDFNNILAAILGNINLALFDQDLKDKTKKLLSEAERASLRAKDLTQQLLTFARGGDPVKEASSLENVIKDSANFVLHGDKVACRYDIPEGLWLVDIDKGQMSQVIQNIVLNASHAMPEGGIVAVTCENVTSGDYSDFPLLPKGRFVKICIQDKGVGMPANVVDKIFDPYFSTKHGGSGLGLAITNSIINKHKGHISVESSPGVGATFTLYLPASEQEKAPSQKSEVYKKASSQAKILLMDDEQMVRAVAKEMLMKLGHEVELSENGKEAIKLYMEAINTNNKFDIVIMDLTIPGGMDGKEAVQEILNLDPDAKVIVSSGYSNDPVMANFKDYGFCSAIVKPYRLQELSKVINQLID